MSTRAIAALLILALPAFANAQESPTVPTSSDRPEADRVRDGIGRGAAYGALATIPLAVVQMRSCGTGCDWSSTGGIMLGWSLLGAAVGSAVGLAADYDAKVVVRPPIRFGIAYTSTAMSSDALSGRAAAPAFAAAVQLSPHISVHMEYVALATDYPAAPGAIPNEVLGNVVDATTRVAGRSYGVESRRVSYIFTELVGVHVTPRPRLRLEFLGGLGVQGEEERAYYDAHRQVIGGRTEPLPGKYYVLDFATPAIGLVLGLDAELAIARGLVIVPTLRYNAMEDSSASISYGAGLHWRF